MIFLWLSSKKFFFFRWFSIYTSTINLIHKNHKWKFKADVKTPYILSVLWNFNIFFLFGLFRWMLHIYGTSAHRYHQGAHVISVIKTLKESNAYTSSFNDTMTPNCIPSSTAADAVFCLILLTPISDAHSISELVAARPNWKTRAFKPCPVILWIRYEVIVHHKIVFRSKNISKNFEGTYHTDWLAGSSSAHMVFRGGCRINKNIAAILFIPNKVRIACKSLTRCELHHICFYEVRALSRMFLLNGSFSTVGMKKKMAAMYTIADIFVDK